MLHTKTTSLRLPIRNPLINVLYIIIAQEQCGVYETAAFMVIMIVFALIIYIVRYPLVMQLEV